MTPPDEFDDWSSWNSWGNFDNSLALDSFQLQEDYNADSGEGEANLGELRAMLENALNPLPPATGVTYWPAGDENLIMGSSSIWGSTHQMEQEAHSISGEIGSKPSPESFFSGHSSHIDARAETAVTGGEDGHNPWDGLPEYRNFESGFLLQIDADSNCVMTSVGPSDMRDDETKLVALARPVLACIVADNLLLYALYVDATLPLWVKGNNLVCPDVPAGFPHILREGWLVASETVTIPLYLTYGAAQLKDSPCFPLQAEGLQHDLFRTRFYFNLSDNAPVYFPSSNEDFILKYLGYGSENPDGASIIQSFGNFSDSGDGFSDSGDSSSDSGDSFSDGGGEHNIEPGPEDDLTNTVIIMPLGNSSPIEETVEVVEQNSRFNLKCFVLSEDGGPRVRTRCAGETDARWISTLPVVGRVAKKLQLDASVIHSHRSAIDHKLVTEYSTFIRSWEARCASVIQGPMEMGGFGFSGLSPSEVVNQAREYQQQDNFLYPGGVNTGSKLYEIGAIHQVASGLLWAHQSLANGSLSYHAPEGGLLDPSSPIPKILHPGTLSMLDRQLYIFGYDEDPPHNRYEEFESQIDRRAEALRPFHVKCRAKLPPNQLIKMKGIKVSIAPQSRFKTYTRHPSTPESPSSSCTTQASGAASGSKPLRVVFENPGEKT